MNSDTLGTDTPSGSTPASTPERSCNLSSAIHHEEARSVGAPLLQEYLDASGTPKAGGYPRVSEFAPRAFSGNQRIFPQRFEFLGGTIQLFHAMPSLELKVVPSAPCVTKPSSS
jgi:hypothetical protein